MEYDCKTCEGRPCNIKGKPSVRKGSAYCDSNRKKATVNRRGLFDGFKDLLFHRNFDAGEKRVKPIKGFRLSWIWR